MSENSNNNNIIIKGSNWVERIIIKALIVMMTLLLIVATGQLAYEFAVSIVLTPYLVELPNLLSLFGTFLMVLIGVELLDTVKVYLKEHVMHVEVVILVAVMAVARKVIVMDFDKVEGTEILGIAGLLIALTIGYYLVRKAGGCDFGLEKDLVIGRKSKRDDAVSDTNHPDTPAIQSPCRGKK